VARKCEDWLQSYLEYTESSESPEDFHIWCGISLIGATLGRRVFLDKGYYLLRPNLFIVLIAESAVSRKSTAIIIASDLMRQALPEENYISQAITPQYLIHILAGRYKKEGDSTGYAIADEFGFLLGTVKNDLQLLELLIKTYDCSEHLDYGTVSRGKETANKSCLSILAGTTPDGLVEVLPNRAVGGGFLSRVIFVPRGRGWRRTAFPELTKRQQEVYSDLMKDLVEIRQREGPYTLTPKAKEWYTAWYESVFTPDEDTASLKGYFGRKHDTLLKVGMCIAASRRVELVVEEHDLEDALGLMNENEKHLVGVMEKVQTTPTGDKNMRVMGVISRKKEISYTDLLRRVSYFLSARDLREILDSLVGGGMVEEEVKGKVILYRPKKGLGV